MKNGKIVAFESRVFSLFNHSRHFWPSLASVTPEGTVVGLKKKGSENKNRNSEKRNFHFRKVNENDWNFPYAGDHTNFSLI